MWMTLNSHAEGYRLGRRCVKLVFAMFVICSSYSASSVALAQEVAPDAPRPARPRKDASTHFKSVGPRKRVELKSVKVVRVDKNTAKLAGVDFMTRAQDPLMIEVRTQDPLGDLTRTSSPVIVLNGEVLSETIPLLPNRLIAYLPDRKAIRISNTVSVVWLGAEEITRSRRPLTFRSNSIK